MTAVPAPSNHPVFLLAEHLDLTLAAIEDLQGYQPVAAECHPQRVATAQDLSVMRFVQEVRRHEMAALVHIGRARDLTRKLVRRDSRFASLGGLFVGGTAALDEAVSRMVDKVGNDFSTGGDPIGYLRSRGVIGDDAGGLSEDRQLAVTDEFRLAGSIETGPLVELVDTFLNTIELHFDLFPDLSEPAENIQAGNELVN